MRLTRNLLPLLLIGTASVASADLTFGGIRAAGMGGAGLALPVDIGNNYRMNPAFLAFGNKSPAFQWPSLGYKLDGVNFGDLRDLVGDLSKGGLDNDAVIRIAQQFGDSDKLIGFNGNLGFKFGGFAIGGKGNIGVNSVPNADLQTWSQSGGSLATLPPTARLDTYGFGSQELEASYGNSVRTKAGKLTVGVNLRKVKSYYAHKFADANTIQTSNSGGVMNGSGLVGDFATKEGTGADVGVLYNPPGADNLFFGMVIENFVEPNIAFNFEAPGGGNPISALGFDPFIRTNNFGVGYVQDKVLLAADWIDVGNRAGRQETRYGAEFKISGSTFFRAGYNSRTAFTYGISLGGFNIQLGGKIPITLATAIRF